MLTEVYLRCLTTSAKNLGEFISTSVYPNFLKAIIPMNLLQFTVLELYTSLGYHIIAKN
jgi:hypothetical protein